MLLLLLVVVVTALSSSIFGEAVKQVAERAEVTVEGITVKMGVTARVNTGVEEEEEDEGLFPSLSEVAMVDAAASQEGDATGNDEEEEEETPV